MCNDSAKQGRELFGLLWSCTLRSIDLKGSKLAVHMKLCEMVISKQATPLDTSILDEYLRQIPTYRNRFYCNRILQQ